MNTGGVTVWTLQDGDQQAIADLRRATPRVDVTDDGLIVVEPPPDALFSGPTPYDDTVVVHDDGGSSVRRKLSQPKPEAILGSQ